MATAAFERALAHLDMALPTSRAAVRRAIGSSVARLLLDFVPRPRRRPPESEVARLGEAARIMRELVWVDVFGNPERVVVDSLGAINAGRRAGVLGFETMGWSGLAFALAFVGRERLSKSLMQRALALSERVEDPGIRALTLQLAQDVAYIWGDFERAAQMGEAALARYRQLGDIQGAGAAQLFLGYDADMNGDFERALASADR